MYDIGRAVENAQWLLLLQKQQCLVLERTGFGIFCRNEMSKMQQNKCAHSTPLPFLCVMIKTYETARSHSLPLSKKGYWHLKLSMGGIYIYLYAQPRPIYIYMLSPPKKQKKQNHGDCRISNGLGFFGFFGFVFLFFWFFVVCFFVFWFFLLFFLVFSQGHSPKSLQIFFCWFNDFFYSLPGILPKEYQNIVVFLFV